MKREIRRLAALVLALLLAMALAAPGFAAGDGYEPEWSLTTLDGGTITQDTYKDKVQLLVFFRGRMQENGDATCMNSSNVIEDLAEADWIDNEQLQIVAIEADDTEPSMIEDFQSAFAPNCDEIVFAYGGTHLLWSVLSSQSLTGGTFSFCAILVDGVLVDFWDACYSARNVDTHLSQYLELSGHELVTVPLYGKYCQSDARSMLNMINSFRTDGEAWVWNSDNSTKTTYPAGTLQALTYDYTLEQIAMQRAAELAVSFSHTRPNGELCLEFAINGISSNGENIAMGQETVDAVFSAWREDQDHYEGQGHRRNMLFDSFQAVGVACFEYDGVKYWVQEFGISNSGAAATAAIDSGKQVPVEYDANEFPDFKPISAPAPSGGGGGETPSGGGGGGGGSVIPAPTNGQDPSLPQLDTPTELAWGKNWTRDKDGNWSYSTLIGAPSFRIGTVTQNQYKTSVYRLNENGESTLFRSMTQRRTDVTALMYISNQWFIGFDYPSGTYYFTVQALGDGTQYRDSDIAKSGNWVYVKPQQKLPTPTGLGWMDNNNMIFSAPQDPLAAYLESEIYVRDENAKADGHNLDGWRWAGANLGYPISSWTYQNGVQIYDQALQSGGSGYYTFKMRFLSSDITQKVGSEWSELSPPRWIGDGDPGTPPDVPSDNPLDNALSDIEKLDQNASAAAKQAAVETAEAALKETGAQTLKENLLTDTDGSGTTQKLIEKAEALKGNKAQPKAATDGLDAATQQQLTQMAQGTEIVGAGLNTDADSVELRIGKPDPDANLVVPAQYGNAVEIRMDLFANGENITAGHQELDVPVKITMPVPAGINPEFLVILHHKADGTINEILRPHLFRGGDGKYYATFVISSFSDFTFAEAQVTAKRTGTGVDVTVTVPDEAAAATSSVVCAAYDTNGKMLGSGLGQFTGGTLNFSIACDSAKAAAVKVFFLGSGSAPVIASIAVEPE